MASERFEMTPTKPHTSHLTDKSIYLRQSIVQAPTPSQFEIECEEYRSLPSFDAYTLEFSRLTYLEKNKSPIHEQTPFIGHVLKLLTEDMTQLIRAKQYVQDSAKDASYTGEKFDLTFSLLNTHLFATAQPLLEKMVEFIDVGGEFDPPLLPSTWRRIWTNTAFLVTQVGFENLRYSRLCQISVAFWNHIYLNQFAFTGHHRRSGPTPQAGPVYVSHGGLLSSDAGSSSPPDAHSIIDLELTAVSLKQEESPLLRGPQAVSAMLAILSHVSGHLALKRATIDLFASMVTMPNAFPRRRMIPLASVLLSLGETKAAMATLHQLQIENPPQIDPKTSQYELNALEFLMVSNNAPAVLQMADELSQVPGHIPSPLALTHIMWAINETHDYDQILKWWQRATVVWRALPNQPSTKRGEAPMKMLVRTPIDATVAMLDVAAEHFACDQLIAMTNDVVEIFGIRPIGERSRIIVKLATDGRWEETLATLNYTDKSTSVGVQVANITSSASSPQSPSSSTSSALSASKGHPHGESTTVNWVIAKLIIASVHQGKFDDFLEALIRSAVDTTHSTFIVGTLIDYVSSLMETPQTIETAKPWIPFLNWFASLPMPDASSSSSSAHVVSQQLSPMYISINQLLEQSRKDDERDITLEEQVRVSAKTCARLAEIAGIAGLPHVVNNIIHRINSQYQLERKGETMPFSLVWFRPLARAHASVGHTDIVFRLLASLKDSMLPSERDAIWKLVFKAYIASNNPDGAIQLFLSIRNKTMDDQIPTWSGGYTMGIQLFADRGEFEPALQLYTLMIEDGFELRDQALVNTLLNHLNTYLINAASSSASSQSQSPSSPLPSPSATSVSNHYERLKKRLELLVLTLDDSRPQQRLDPAALKRRRYAKLRNKAERAFVKDLDRTMSRYKPRPKALHPL